MSRSIPGSLASEERERLLNIFKKEIEATLDGFFGLFSGICLYELLNGKWNAFTIKANQSQDIVITTEWLRKQEWRGWN